jgi:hypothetical protein
LSDCSIEWEKAVYNNKDNNKDKLPAAADDSFKPMELKDEEG